MLAHGCVNQRKYYAEKCSTLDAVNLYLHAAAAAAQFGLVLFVGKRRE